MPKYLFANEIYPGLWLGDTIAGSSIDLIKSNNIKYVFNVSRSMPFCSREWKLKGKYRIPILDDLSDEQNYKMYLQLNKCAKLIAKILPSNNILVHCHAGRPRSATIIAAFLMKYGKLSMNEAIETIRSKRCIACLPLINFYKALEQYQCDIQSNLKNL